MNVLILDMEADKVTEALDYLESQGFYIKNLWHIQDVQDKFDCTEEEAFEVLEEAVSGEWVIEAINERINMFGLNNNLDSK
jgi:hypothetical protein